MRKRLMRERPAPAPSAGNGPEPADWDRLVGDSELLRAARSAYEGTGAFADQLWWIAHPGTTAPSGAVDPVLALERAQRDLYRQGADPDAAAEVAAARAAQESDRALALVALAGLARATSGAARPVSRRRPWRRAVIALVAVVAAGAALGLPIDPLRSPRAASNDALDRPQHAADRIEVAGLRGLVDPRSTRLLRTLSTIGTTVYGGRRPDGRRCLVAVVLATSASASCTTQEGFERAGLSLVVQAAADPVDGAGHLPVRDINLVWGRDGAVRAIPLG